MSEVDRILQLVEQGRGSPEQLLALARKLVALGRPVDAVRVFERVIDGSPRWTEARSELVSLLWELQAWSDAGRHLDALLDAAPQDVMLQLRRAQLLRMTEGLDASVAALDALATQNPRDPRVQWARLCALPVLYRSGDELAPVRAAFERQLTTLEGLAERDLARDPQRFDAAILLDFHLHYQNGDDVELQRRFGALVSRIGAANHPEWAVPRPSATDVATRRLRVGFVSAFFRSHTVHKLFGAWLDLDRERFEVFTYHLGTAVDERTQEVAAKTRFLHLPGPPAEAARQIVADDLDLLIYPEVGMDGHVLRLAAWRLAPRQWMAWGHPVTSGLPTIDAFLTSDAMEPATGERHYTETLLRLPGTSLCYERPEVGEIRADRDAFGLESDAVVYLACQSLFKYLPENDALFPAIAQQVPDARFAFIANESEAMNTLFDERMHAAFEAQGLEAATHVVRVPRLSEIEYQRLNASSDIYLDSVGWSGGNTSLEAIAHGLPIVAFPSTLMRGRHTAALLQQMGLDDLIAESLDGYVELAVRLGRDQTFRAETRSRIAERAGRLYEDRSAIAALETRIEQAVLGG